MKRPPLPEDESWESDAVWKLLDAAPPASAGPRFADDVLRAVRLAEPAKPWWKRVFTPLPVAGLAASAAAVALALHVLAPAPPALAPVATAPAVTEDAFADVQEAADAEALIAAADHLDQFSDNELASLAGF
jgi:hypothetical protein